MGSGNLNRRGGGRAQSGEKTTGRKHKFEPHTRKECEDKCKEKTRRHKEDRSSARERKNYIRETTRVLETRRDRSQIRVKITLWERSVPQ